MSRLLQKHRRRWRWALLLSVAAFASAGARALPALPAASDPGYAHYAIGDQGAVAPDSVQPGLLLNGGGEWPMDAFRWFVARAGHGHLVVLRASLADEVQTEFYKVVGGIASAETFVFTDRRAASAPEVLAAIKKADGIFIAGGDQSRYVRFWKDTPLSAALDRHVRAGKPIGGTSAGLAILGGHVYGAMDGGSMTAPVALRDPLGSGMTLVGDFLHLPFLQHVITDSHFSERQRLGRLIGFLAKLRTQGAVDVIGLGIDESASLCIDGEGMGRVYTRGEAGKDDEGYVWVVQPAGPPARVEAGHALTFEGLRLTGVGTRSRLDLRDFSVKTPAFHRMASVVDGRLVVMDAAPARAEKGGE